MRIWIITRLKVIKLTLLKKSSFWIDFRRNLIAGVLTLIPIWVTWLVFSFVVGKMSEFGAPWVRALSVWTRDFSPALADWLVNPWTRGSVAAVITLIGLYVLGFLTSHVLGKRLLLVFDEVVSKTTICRNYLSFDKDTS